jgi:hypothetical protein
MTRNPRLAKEVLSYFVRYPDATDDLEGVAHWRLVQEAIHRGIDDTREALEWLVSAGFLRQHSTTKGPLFSLNTENCEKAESFLASLERDEAAR